MTDKVANDYYKAIPWIASSKSSDQKSNLDTSLILQTLYSKSVVMLKAVHLTMYNV